MTRPSRDEMYAEMAGLSQTFHWPVDAVLDLEHGARRRWLAEIDG